MAKPGDDARQEMARLAAMSRGAADLGGGEITGPMAEKGRAAAERQLGMRCGGCDRRIGVGFQFTRIEVVMRDAKPLVDVMRLSACDGAEGCDYAEQARKGADVVELVEYAWLSGEAPVGVKGEPGVERAAAAARARANGAGE